MGSFAEEREIEGLKRKWKIADVEDFEEIEKADTFSLPSITIKEEKKLSSSKNTSSKITSALNSSISNELTLTTLFKMKKKTEKKKAVTKDREVSQEISKLTLSNFFKKVNR